MPSTYSISIVSELTGFCHDASEQSKSMPTFSPDLNFSLRFFLNGQIITLHKQECAFSAGNYFAGNSDLTIQGFVISKNNNMNAGIKLFLN